MAVAEKTYAQSLTAIGGGYSARGVGEDVAGTLAVGKLLIRIGTLFVDHHRVRAVVVWMRSMSPRGWGGRSWCDCECVGIGRRRGEEWSRAL